MARSRGTGRTRRTLDHVEPPCSPACPTSSGTGGARRERHLGERRPRPRVHPHRRRLRRHRAGARQPARGAGQGARRPRQARGSASPGSSRTPTASWPRSRSASRSPASCRRRSVRPASPSRCRTCSPTRAWPTGRPTRVALVLVTLVISYFSLVFSELAPKRLALQRPEGVAMAFAPALDRIASLSRPVIWLLSKSTDVVVRLLGGDPTVAGRPHHGGGAARHGGGPRVAHQGRAQAHRRRLRRRGAPAARGDAARARRSRSSTPA